MITIRKYQNIGVLLNKSVANQLYSTAKQTKKTKWKSVVGLEVHAQIASSSKLFSGASVEFGGPINNCVALLDASIPGTLPVLNKKCVEAGVQTALALSSNINAVSMFDRKHYFYADLPAGYQITQQRAPLAKGGSMTFPVFAPGVTKKPYYKTVRLTQLQLEQDSGKSLHDDYLGRSLVDLNRAGVPLMEFVFEPDLTDGEEAASLVKELVLILTRLGTCNCRMEEGGLRVDANISIHKENEPLGIRTEVKNIGSIRGVAQAVAFEIQRQIEIKDNGGTIKNATRAWDANTKTTIAMRDKEVVQDYRFMPEPNLPPLHLNLTESISKDLINVQEIKKKMPELPETTRNFLMNEMMLPQELAIILVNEDRLLELFNQIMKADPKRKAKVVALLLVNELLTVCNKNKITVKECKILPNRLGPLIDMLESEYLSSKLASLILEEMFIDPRRPQEISDEKGWKQISDSTEIQKYCEEAVAGNPKLVALYQSGKTKVLFALIGEIAKKTENKINLVKVTEMLKEMMQKK